MTRRHPNWFMADFHQPAKALEPGLVKAPQKITSFLLIYFKCITTSTFGKNRQSKVTQSMSPRSQILRGGPVFFYAILRHVLSLYGHIALWFWTLRRLTPAKDEMI